MGLDKIVKSLSLIGIGKYFGRSALDAAFIYSLFKVQGSLEDIQIIELTGSYTLIRYAVDMFDSLYLKQGRMYDHIFRPMRKNQEGDPPR